MKTDYVIDTSVVIEKAVSKLISQGKIKGKVLIPKALIAELEYAANDGQEIGLLGLEELQELQKLSQEGKIDLQFIGERPKGYRMKFEELDIEIDSSIRDLAYKISGIMNFKGNINWDAAKPDGQPRRCLDTSKAKHEFDFEARTSFDEGLRKTIEWYLGNKQEQTLSL